jgi:predicted kinase
VNRFVVITGLPASGKSAIGRSIAEALALPILDKDDFLEALLRRSELPDASRRRELSRLADEEFRAYALAHPEAVLISWWRHPRSVNESGTPSNWLSLLRGSVVEVHCSCRPIVAAERFVARRRHPGHLDDERSYSQLLDQFNEQVLLGPLGVGALIEVDTNVPIDAEALLISIKGEFAQNSQCKEAN